MQSEILQNCRHRRAWHGDSVGKLTSSESRSSSRSEAASQATGKRLVNIRRARFDHDLNEWSAEKELGNEGVRPEPALTSEGRISHVQRGVAEFLVNSDRMNGARIRIYRSVRKTTPATNTDVATMDIPRNPPWRDCSTAVQQYSSTAVQQYSSTAVQQYSSTAVQQYSPTPTRRASPAGPSFFRADWCPKGSNCCVYSHNYYNSIIAYHSRS